MPPRFHRVAALACLALAACAEAVGVPMKSETYFSTATKKTAEDAKACIQDQFFALPRAEKDEVPIKFKETPDGWIGEVHEYTGSGGDLFVAMFDPRSWHVFKWVTYKDRMLSLETVSFAKTDTYLVTSWFPLAPGRVFHIVPMIKACA